MFWRILARELHRQFLTPERLAHYCRIGINLILIVIAAILVNWFITKNLRRLIRRHSRLTHESRVLTVITLIQSLVGYLIFFLALILGLRALGVDYTAILAGAGVVGLAVGFGAQALIRDFISGFFLLFEGLIGVGDYITTGDVNGTVERIGLRITQVRAFDGTLFTIPNGELVRFGNQNRDFMRALVTVDIAYKEDVTKATEIARAVAEQWHRDNPEICLEPPNVLGISSFSESGMRLLITCKVRPLTHWQAERELRGRLKQAFDAAGMDLNLPRRMVISRTEQNR